MNFSILTAQTSISGTVIDIKSESPLAYAEIVLIGTDNVVVSSITDDAGVFKVDVPYGDQYTFQINHLGEKIYEKTITAEDKLLDLGLIRVETILMIDAIILNSKKKLIENKVDRLVFNVANTTKSSRGDVMELLRITPGVRVENDNISLIGKGALQVMINGKILKFSGVDLINFLRSFASEDIKKIEVINNPPAKYEASGDSGLINIVLKGARMDSWNVLLKGTYLQRKRPTWRSYAIFTYRKNRLSLQSRIGYNHQYISILEKRRILYDESDWSINEPVNIETEGYVANINLAYNLTDQWEIGGEYYYNGTLMNLNSPKTTLISPRGTDEVERKIYTNHFETQDPARHVVNFYNNLDLDSLGRNIKINFDYLLNDNPNLMLYNGNSEGVNFDTEYFRSLNQSNDLVENYSGKVDVEYPFETINFSFGGKFSNSKSTNDISTFNSGFVDNPDIEISPIYNDFIYRENIQALYFSMDKDFNNKWSGKFGLRFERTDVDAQSNSLNFSREDVYNNLFPTLYLSYQATDNSLFAINYGKRINRPGFFLLNPATYYINPFEKYNGNPYLKPALIHNVEFSNVYKNLVSKIYYSEESSNFGEIPLPDNSTNITMYSYENYIDRQRIGLSENYTYEKIDWWTANFNFDINYSFSSFNHPQNFKDQYGISSYVSTNNDFTLNTKETIIAGLNYWYSFPGVDGIFRTESSNALSLSLQFLLLDKNLSITMLGNDIFKTGLQRRNTNINGVYQEMDNYYDTRQFRLMVTYKFGNKNISAKNNDSNNKDAQSRLY